MPSKRTRRNRNRRPDMPAWAEALLRGELPERGSADWSAYLGWKFFFDNVAGLPEATTAAGRALVERVND